jgi:hypothetical protein
MAMGELAAVVLTLMEGPLPLIQSMGAGEAEALELLLLEQILS